MTVGELIGRIKATSVTEGFATIANDSEQAREFALTLGPHLVAPLLREERRKRAVVRGSRPKREQTPPMSDAELEEVLRRLAKLPKSALDNIDEYLIAEYERLQQKRRNCNKKALATGLRPF